MPTTNKTRLKIALVTCLFLLFCIPIWWRSTGAFQTTIPHQRINANLNKTLCKIPLSILVINHSPFASSLPSIKMQVQDAVKLAKNANDLDTILYKHVVNENLQNQFLLFLFNGNDVAANLLVDKVYIGQYRHAFALVSKQEQVEVLEQALRSVIATTTKHKDKNQIAPHTHYHVSFTLLYSDPSMKRFWNFEHVKQHYLQPFFNKIALPYHLESQVMFHGNLPSKPKYDSASKEFHIAAHSIQFLLNENDWKLESPAHEEPTLHVLIYVPQKRVRPLRVLDYDQQPSKTNSFVIPQWGTVIVWNGAQPSSNTSTAMNNEDVHCLMQIAIAQLRGMFGLSNQYDSEHVISIPSTSGIADWELDQVSRIHQHIYLQRALHSLDSLSRVVNKMPNVRVQEQISHFADASLSHVQHAVDMSCQQQSNNSLSNIVQETRLALEDAEQAFFHPSMLSLLYFPDTQKAMVYLPLISPILIISLAGLFRELKRRIKR